MREVAIKTEYIKLDALLKYAGACMTGGEAKARIEQGEVLFNGEPCVQRGKKCRPGDVIALMGEELRVTAG